MNVKFSDSITCSRCGTINDSDDTFCLDCGSKLYKDTSSLFHQSNDKIRYFSLNRPTHNAFTSSIYEFNNSNVLFKVKVSRNFFKHELLAIILFSLLIISIFSVIIISHFFNLISYIVIFAGTLIFIFSFFFFFLIIFRISLFIESSDQQVVGLIIPFFSLYQLKKSLSFSSWSFCSPQDEILSSVDIVNSSSGTVTYRSNSYSFTINKDSNNLIIIKDSNNEILLRVFPDNDSKVSNDPKNFFFSLHYSLDLPFAIFFTTVVMNKIHIS